VISPFPISPVKEEAMTTEEEANALIEKIVNDKRVSKKLLLKRLMTQMNSQEGTPNTTAYTNYLASHQNQSASNRAR